MVNGNKLRASGQNRIASCEMIEPDSSIANLDYAWWQVVADMSLSHELSPLIVDLDPMHGPLVGAELTCGGREERVCLWVRGRNSCGGVFPGGLADHRPDSPGVRSFGRGADGRGLGGAVPSRPPLKTVPLRAQKRFEGVPEASLQFEPDAGNHRRFCGTGRDRHVVAVAAERLETERIDLSASQAKPSGDMQAE